MANEELLKKYFALKEPNDCASDLMRKSESFYNKMKTNNHIEKLKKMWHYYHGFFSGSNSDHEISFAGEQGELVRLPVNHFRNIGQHVHNLITSTRPILEARAINTDYKSIIQTQLANSILDYYMREKALEKRLVKAAEYAVVFGYGFLKMDWNATSGEGYDIDPDTGELSYEGEIEFKNLSPLDVVFDGTKEEWDHDWLLVRSYENRFNLMAKYPELAEKIQGIEAKDSDKYRLTEWSNDETDDIPVYEFFHKKNESVPEGRYLLFLSPEISLLDTKLPYKRIPVFRLAFSEILGTPYGYTNMFDLYPMQEALNSMSSTIMTNIDAYGVQNLFVRTGANLNLQSIGGQLNIIEGNEKPERIDPPSTPMEVYNFRNAIIGDMETVSGISSVTRGNPEKSLRSGNSLALVQSMSLQFINGFQQNYIRFIEESGTAVIEILQDYAQTPKLVALVGKNNRVHLKEFTGNDLNSISRVVVDVGNALSRTIAGRVEMADNLLAKGILKNPAQYFQVINTGRVDVTYEGDIAQLNCIRKENEMMLEGEMPIVSLLDSHRMHIMEHQSIISDPNLRENPKLVMIIQNHVQEHINILRTADPDLLQMIGETPLNIPAQAGNPVQPPAPEGAAPMAGGPSSPTNPMMPPAGPEPIDPTTGEPMPLPAPASVDSSLLPNPSLEPLAR